MRLLHLDGDRQYLRTLHSELLRNGAVLCEIDSATELDSAQGMMEQSEYDAIVIDPGAFDVDPATACGVLHDVLPHVPIVVLTTENSDLRAVEAVAAGASDYLIKENSQPQWLMRRVRYAIERAKAARQRVRRPVLLPQPLAAGAAVGEGHSAERAAHGGSTAPGTSPPRASAAAHPRRAAATGPVFRVLHVEDDPAFPRLVAKLMGNAGALRFEIEHVDHLPAAIERLQQATYDLVMLDLSLPESAGLSTFNALLPHAESIPLIVLTACDDDASAIEGMQAGAEDYLTKTEPNLRYCPRAAQIAITRHCRLSLEDVAREAAERADDAVAYPVTERREHQRYLLTKPIFVIPILPDGSPAEPYGADGFSVDVSEGGVQFEIGGLDYLPTKQLLLGIEASDTVLHFAVVETRRSEPTAIGLRVGARFATGDRDLLRPENLEPRFNAATHRFEVGLPLETISKWVEFGIFRATLMDRVLICPKCQAIPTFRNGCRVCGSVRLHSRPLIHHFACAHVGYVSDFEQDAAMVCPKCRTRNLIVGADYEHLNGPYRCLDCDWSDTELELVGQCLSCEFRFPMHEALEEDLIGYHVHRLDALALINAP